MVPYEHSNECSNDEPYKHSYAQSKCVPYLESDAEPNHISDVASSYGSSNLAPNRKL